MTSVKTMKRAEYLKDENWHGSYYECALELGPYGNDALVMQALEALWRQPELCGPWVERSHFGHDPDQIALASSGVRLYGCLALGAGGAVGCVSQLVRVEAESDWLDLSIPTGMLDLRFPVVYPLDTATNPWLVTVDRVLVRIAEAVYATAPFLLGLIGEEASWASSAREITAQDCERGGFLVPDDLWRKLEPNRKGERLSSGLVYAPLVGPHITYGG